MTVCPDDEQLRAVLAGQSSAAESLSAHIAGCPNCLSRLEAWTSDTVHAQASPTQFATPEPALSALMQRLRQAPPAEPAGALRFPGPITPDAPLGQLGPYFMLRQLGQGGNGLLFLARDTKLNRLVALKVLRPELAAQPSARQRFEREARAVASLQHPHILAIHDVATPPDFPPYLVMEYIDGQSLAELGQVPSVQQAAGLVAQAAEGLAAAHARGLVHRDVKPSNLLLERSTGLVKVVDFGLALDSDLPHLTHEGQIIGTPAYMSPEQAAGAANQVDARTDVYGLGAVFYFLLTGRPPFTGNTRQVLYHVLHHEPESPRRTLPSLPRDLETIVMHCLAKKPERRYGTAADLAADVHRFLRGEPVQARPIGRGERLMRWCQRNRALAAVTAAACLLLVVGAGSGIVAAVQYQQQRQATDAVVDREQQIVRRDQRTAERDRLHAQLRMGDDNYEWVNYETARDHYRQALVIGEALLKAHPTDVRCQEDLARAHQKLGEVQEDLLEIDEAVKHYERSRLLNEQVLKVEPNNLSAKELLALVCGWLAEIYELEKDQPQQAAELYRRADTLLDELVSVATRPDRLAELVLLRADLLCHCRRVAEAAAAADLLRRRSQQDSYALYCSATCYAKCFGARGQGARSRDQYAQLAIEVLREAVAAGFDDVRMVQKDPDWKALQGNSQLRSTIAQMRKTRTAK